RCAPLPLVGRGWGGGPSADHRTTPTPALRADPPHKGEGTTELAARADSALPEYALDEWDRQHVLLEGRALLEGGEPALEIVERRPLRHQAGEGVGHQRDRNVAHGQCVAGDERGLGEVRVEKLHHLDALALARLDRRMIALLRRRADESPEDRRERRMRDRELPVHPAARPRPRARI